MITFRVHTRFIVSVHFVISPSPLFLHHPHPPTTTTTLVVVVVVAVAVVAGSASSGNIGVVWEQGARSTPVRLGVWVLGVN